MLALFLSVFLLQATYLDLYNSGHELLDQGRPREAEAVLRESASQKPDYLPTLKDLGEAYARLGRLEDAIEQYSKAVEVSPRDIRARGRLAELYSWAGNHDKSIVTYKDALEIAPENIALKNGLGTVLRWSHRYEEAERLYREVLHESPEDHDALKGLAKTYSMSGDLAGAIQTFEKAIEIYPDDAELYKEIGTALAWRKNYAEALEHLDRAVELSPGYLEALRTIGDVHFWARSYPEALAAYKKVVDAEPDNTDNHLLVAKVYVQMDNARMAEESIKDALRIDPSATDALEMLRELRATNGAGHTFFNTLGEVIELGIFIFVFVLLFMTYRSKRRMLQRRHRLYFYFSNIILPALVVLTFASYLGKDALTRWFDTTIVEDVMEGVLFFALGVSFLTLLWTERRSQKFTNSVLLVVGAHPDDIELGCGGYIMKVKDGGGSVYGLTMTRGEKGAEDVKMRKAELGRAARFMELDGFWQMDFPDTRLDTVISEMKDLIEEKINETGATTVLTHTDMDIHSDHRAVFESTKVAGRRISIMSYEDVSTPGEFMPNYYADITDYIEDKMKLVSLHKSQGDKTYMDPEAIKGRAAHRGLQANVQYAEAFRVYKLLR